MLSHINLAIALRPVGSAHAVSDICTGRPTPAQTDRARISQLTSLQRAREWDAVRDVRILSRSCEIPFAGPAHTLRRTFHVNGNSFSRCAAAASVSGRPLSDSDIHGYALHAACCPRPPRLHYSSDPRRTRRISQPASQP